MKGIEITRANQVMRGGELLLAAAILLSTGCAGTSGLPATDESPTAPDMPWTYEGAAGPATWADRYAECGGTAQSPVDLRPTAIADLQALQFSYGTIRGSVVDAGYALQVTTDGGSLTIDDGTFTLRRISFHVPSMHTLDGRRFQAGMQLVHEGDDGGLVIVEVLFVLGSRNELLSRILAAPAGPQDAPSAAEISLEGAAPDRTAYYTYEGSLTEPPCTEGVRWFVMRHPQTLSQDQLDQLADHYRNNVRPVQPRNDRIILHRPG